MKRRVAIIAVMTASMVSVTVALLATQSYAQTRTDMKKRLVTCGSFANGSTVTVAQATRLFINLPKGIYPTQILKISPHGALAGFSSEGGDYGYGFATPGKANCWSYSFRFMLSPTNKGRSGNVDISSKSAVRGISNYLIHIKVLANVPNSTSTPPSMGVIHGQVILGPICPVERIPPDPACAPKPYVTRIDIRYLVSDAPYKSLVTDSSGGFTLSLEPGAYVLSTKGGSTYPRCNEVPVNVVTGKTQNVTVNCDTGIR